MLSLAYTMNDNLISEIKRQLSIFPDESPIVSLEQFFYGNTDESSIGCNLLNHPGIDVFNSVLLKIRKQENVQDVLIEIYEYEDVGEWPYSERIYMLTSASKSEIEDWVKELGPTEVDEGWIDDCVVGKPVLRNGYTVFNLWWD